MAEELVQRAAELYKQCQEVAAEFAHLLSSTKIEGMLQLYSRILREVEFWEQILNGKRKLLKDHLSTGNVPWF